MPTTTVKCESCGKANVIDAVRGGACDACGHALLPPQPQPQYRQQPYQQMPPHMPPHMPISISDYMLRQPTAASAVGIGIGSCISIIVAVVIVGLIGVGLFIGFADATLIDDISSSVGFGNTIPELDATLLAKSDFGGTDAVALSHHGRWLAYSENDQIVIYDLSTNREFGTIPIAFSEYSLGFSADDQFLVGNNGSHLVLYSVEGLAVTREFTDHIVSDIHVNSAGTLATLRINRSSTYHVFDLETFAIVADIPTISELGLPDIALSAAGNYALVIHPDAYRMIDLANNRDIPLGFNKVNSGAWSATADVLYISADEGVHRITVTDGVPEITREYDLPNSIYSLSNEPIAVSSTGDALALVYTGLTEFYRYDTDEETAQAKGKTESFIREMFITENFVITADTFGNIQRWD